MARRSADDEVYEALLEAMKPLEGVAYTAGDTDQPLAGSCPECGSEGQLRYTGTTVLEGSLEHYHLVHTEVEHHLACRACGRDWTVFKLL